MKTLQHPNGGQKVSFTRIIAMISALVIVSSLIGCVEGESEDNGAIEQEFDVKKGLVILTEYPDVKHTVDRAYAQERFGKLDTYIREMSYNKVRIDADVTEKWYELPEPVSYYSISSRNLEVDRSRLEALIEDAIDAADKDVDFNKYDFTAIFMSTRMEEYGMIGLCGYPGMLGWQTSDFLETESGEAVKNGVAIFCYHAHPGTLFHDVAHILGGVQNGKRMVPCLYDHDLQAAPGPIRDAIIGAMINMGFWDPMSCHFYEPDLPPPGISSWTKMRLNWIDQSKIKIIQPGITEIQLDPLENDTSDVLTIKIPLSDTTYYLIENRQPIGVYDEILPGSGVLIMYANDEIAECRHGNAPVKLIDADPSIPHLEGAAFDVGENGTFVDNDNGLKIQLLEKVGNSYKISINWQ